MLLQYPRWASVRGSSSKTLFVAAGAGHEHVGDFISVFRIVYNGLEAGQSLQYIGPAIASFNSV
jgi:hypothetical protein